MLSSSEALHVELKQLGIYAEVISPCNYLVRRAEAL
jgi:hypothetical protein